MRTKIIFLLLVILGYSYQSSGQNKKLPEDELKKELKLYLRNQNELTEEDSVIIYIVDLLDFHEYNGETGIYKFGVIGPHFLPYLVFVKDNKFRIIKDYRTISVIRSFEKFIKIKEWRLTEIQKTQLLKNLAGVLYNRMKMIEDNSIGEDIEF